MCMYLARLSSLVGSWLRNGRVALLLAERGLEVTGASPRVRRWTLRVPSAELSVCTGFLATRRPAPARGGSGDDDWERRSGNRRSAGLGRSRADMRSGDA